MSLYFKYFSNSKNNITLLDIYYPNEIFNKYIVQVVGKDFTIVNYLFKVYRLSDTHEYINRNLPLHLILNIDMRQSLIS